MEPRNRSARTRRVALCGVLCALALVFGYIEHLLPLPIGIPGVKLGLANLVTLLLLYLTDAKTAFSVNLIRILLSGLLFGSAVSLSYSLAGGLLAFFAMLLIKKLGCFSIVGVSVCGGIAHNVGQMAVAAFLVSELRILLYLPILLIAGTLTGFLLGLCGTLILKRYQSQNK